nr:DUF6493 family protein [Capnocytophaga haemolytica]
MALTLKKSPLSFSFAMLVALWEAGDLTFDEGPFAQRLYNSIWGFQEEQGVSLVALLAKQPELAEKVLSVLPLYMESLTFDNQLHINFFKQLQEKGILPVEAFVTAAFEALLAPRKKPVLDLLCRLIEVLHPSNALLLCNQERMLALLSLGNSSLINFALPQLRKIAQEKAFDAQAFHDNFFLCANTPRIGKSILIGLEIVEQLIKQEGTKEGTEGTERLGVFFTISDEKVQQRVAQLLTTYYSKAVVDAVVLPYRVYLKEKVAAYLAEAGVTPEEDSSAKGNLSEVYPTRTPEPLKTIATWDELLFAIGDSLREGTTAQLDAIFEAFVSLQDALPANYAEQIAPYVQQLKERFGIYYQYYGSLYKVLTGEVYKDKYSHYYPKEEHDNFSFLRDKAEEVLTRQASHNTLGFLSTPTQQPFYIDPAVLEERLQAYKAAGVSPLAEDVTVAQARCIGAKEAEVYPKYEVKKATVDYYERYQLQFKKHWGAQTMGENIAYQLSLQPNAIDRLVLRYILPIGVGERAEPLHAATRVVQLLLQWQLPVKSGGWLFVATCLIGEKQPLRDMATDYLLWALGAGVDTTYLADCTRRLLASKYAPVKRFLEFTDRPLPYAEVKAFTQAVVQNYKKYVDERDKPSNHKLMLSL